MHRDCLAPLHFIKTLFNVLINKDLYDYTLKLKATLESSSPIKDTFTIDIFKIGKMEL